MADDKEKKEAAAASDEGAQPKGGGGGLLPLIIALVAMPALAYATTTFVLLPKLQAAINAQGGGGEGHGDDAQDDDSHGDGGHGGGHGDAHGGGHGGHGEKSGAGNMYDLGKVLVNPKGSAGTRYLVAKYTLKGKSADFESQMESAKPQLLDIASSVMASKSLVDLEQPGARNLIRNELLAALNSALGGGAIKEIYITEFAIQ